MLGGLDGTGMVVSGMGNSSTDYILRMRTLLSLSSFNSLADDKRVHRLLAKGIVVSLEGGDWVR